MTLLIADYMNMIGRSTGPGSLASLPATPKARMTPSRSSSRARGILTTAPNTPRPDHRETVNPAAGFGSPSMNFGGSRDLNATPRLSRKWSHLTSLEPNNSTNWEKPQTKIAVTSFTTTSCDLFCGIKSAKVYKNEFVVWNFAPTKSIDDCIHNTVRCS